MNIKASISEIIGTTILVLFGCGSAVFAVDSITNTGVSFAFGFAIIASAYSLGAFSQVHLNPAVTLGALMCKRISFNEAIVYIISQFIGGILGAFIIYLISMNMPNVSGYGENLYASIGVVPAFIFESIATFIFLIVILGVTSKKGNADFAGLTIGFTLTMIHLIGIPLTGVSVNPARSLGPALFAGGEALSQVWLFILAPILGGVVAGLLYYVFFQDGKKE